MKLEEIVKIDEKIMREAGISPATKVTKVVPLIWEEDIEYDWPKWLVKPVTSHQTLVIYLEPEDDKHLSFSPEGVLGNYLITSTLEIEDNMHEPKIVFIKTMVEILELAKNLEILDLSEMKKK